MLPLRYSLGVPMRSSLLVTAILLFMSFIYMGCVPEQAAEQTPSTGQAVREERDQLPANGHADAEPDTHPILLPPFPDEIELSFVPLELNEVPTGEPSPDWVFEKSILLELGEEAELALYREVSGDTRFVDRVHGVLSFRDQQMVLNNLSFDFLDQDVNRSRLGVFRQSMPGQNQLTLLGAVAVFANGPGLNTYLIYDEQDAVLRSFDAWGEPDFIDLDGDGNEELVIEFPGLHLNWPDVAIVRSEGETLEVSWSTVDPVRRDAGDYAILVKENTRPFFQLSNVWSEEEPVYTYTYMDESGILKRCESGCAVQ